MTHCFDVPETEKHLASCLKHSLPVTQHQYGNKAHPQHDVIFGFGITKSNVTDQKNASYAYTLHSLQRAAYKCNKKVRANLDTYTSDVIFRRALLAQHESLFSSAYSFHRKASLWQPQPYQDSLCD